MWLDFKVYGFGFGLEDLKGPAFLEIFRLPFLIGVGHDTLHIMLSVIRKLLMVQNDSLDARANGRQRVGGGWVSW